ncbi:TrlF family AAA-like ATPase [Hymenobacter weizhouensis]|uniref:TrlF family AAA-like ATPase n=1 Tax=Hymenobacter sp. YIM 151500-1 TaxID=2987689 RepID=UPI002227BD46|nr:AAA family ATPase [Hymenobacter sp. YIM 151500-1]UYZ61600.1 AAA family ATPase [Hymenobacter sp. YIM 151500-1]
MDKGAHFHNCDFQVHTPRDINWNGDRAITDDQRKAYSNEFIQACRDKKLDAVAITDHHDFAFFKYIKEASINEVDSDGNLIASDERITVFPGIELSLSVPPCQALLILDSDFPVDALHRILTKLSLTPSPEEEHRTANTERISGSIVMGLQHLYDMLDSMAEVKGRYIVLPNVSEGGNHTLLRSGHADYYKSMPCVGGYLDGSIEQLGIGRKDIIDGKNREYGNKPVGIFQTSDNRRRDFANLGLHTTWAKWAEPTAEAIRQACLAKESRLEQQTPELPSIFIAEIIITNSKFLGPVGIQFNKQYNALIGGRGTGKSTVLEYLRWGLCDQGVESMDEDDMVPFQVRRKSLVEKTLKKFDGEVIITLELNDILHVIKRSSKDHSIQLKIGNGVFNFVDESTIRTLLPIQAYSQKQLSSVGVRVEELRRIIESPVRKELHDISVKIEAISDQIKSTYNELSSKKRAELEKSRYGYEISSLTKQIEEIRGAISSSDGSAYSKLSELKSGMDADALLISKWESQFLIVQRLMDDLKYQLSIFPIAKTDNQMHGNEKIFEAYSILGNLSRVAQHKIDEMRSLFSIDNIGTYNTILAEWRATKQKIEGEYEELSSQVSGNVERIESLKKIENRTLEVKKMIDDTEKVLTKVSKAHQLYTELKAEWIKLHRDKISFLAEQCSIFSALSNGVIKADMAKSLDYHCIKERLKNYFAGMNIREAKVNDMAKAISDSTEPIDSWLEFMADLEKLADISSDDISDSPLPTTPLLSEIYGFGDNERTRIIKSTTRQTWLELALAELEFVPIIKYVTNARSDQSIDFSEASAGQQATALLNVLLNQDGYPLIIDQPEDDIDNRAIDQIIKMIWKSKKKRQLIFASHNANLVVNGDAELVVCFDYVNASDQSRGTIKVEGAIDNQFIKTEVTSVMEGGEKAFKLRKEKYGF